MIVKLDESQRQIVLLSLAELALSRPGWNEAILEAVKEFGGLQAVADWKSFKTSNRDRVKETHGAL